MNDSIIERKVAFERIEFTEGGRSLPLADVLRALERHSRGDWGELCEEDKGLNDWQLEQGKKVVAWYHTRAGIQFLLVTYARTETWVMLPMEN